MAKKISTTVPVYVSRHGAKNGKDVQFDKCEKVTYRMRDGTVYNNVVIASKRKVHKSDHSLFGYEAKFLDGKFFIVDEGIIGWEHD